MAHEKTGFPAGAGRKKSIRGAGAYGSENLKIAAHPLSVEAHRRAGSAAGRPVSLCTMADVSRERAGEPEIATTTLAEIYVQQGLYDRALVIYRRLAERTPGDERVAARVAEIEAEMERLRAGGEPVPVRPLVVPRPGGSAPSPPLPPPTVPAVADDAEFLAWLDRR
jgi:hypothetical protein